jgi:hypothetical protein
MMTVSCVTIAFHAAAELKRIAFTVHFSFLYRKLSRNTILNFFCSGIKGARLNKKAEYKNYKC